MVFWMARVGTRHEPSAMFNSLEGANIFGFAVLREVSAHDWLQLWVFKIHAPESDDLIRENVQPGVDLSVWRVHGETHGHTSTGSMCSDCINNRRPQSGNAGFGDV